MIMNVTSIPQKTPGIKSKLTKSVAEDFRFFIPGSPSSSNVTKDISRNPTPNIAESNTNIIQYFWRKQNQLQRNQSSNTNSTNGTPRNFNAYQSDPNLTNNNINSNFFTITKHILQSYFKVSTDDLSTLRLVDLIVDQTYPNALTLRKLNDDSMARPYHYFNTVSRDENISRCPIFSLAVYFLLKWHHPNPPISNDNYYNIPLLDPSFLINNPNLSSKPTQTINTKNSTKPISRSLDYDPPKELIHLIFPWLDSMTNELSFMGSNDYQLHSLLELFEFIAKVLIQDLKYLSKNHNLLPNIVSFVIRFIPELFQSEYMMKDKDDIDITFLNNSINHPVLENSQELSSNDPWNTYKNTTNMNINNINTSVNMDTSNNFIKENGIIQNSQFLESSKNLISSLPNLNDNDISKLLDSHYLSISKRLTTENVRLSQQVANLRTDLNSVNGLCKQLLEMQKQIVSLMNNSGTNFDGSNNNSNQFNSIHNSNLDALLGQDSNSFNNNMQNMTMNNIPGNNGTNMTYLNRGQNVDNNGNNLIILDKNTLNADTLNNLISFVQNNQNQNQNYQLQSQFAFNQPSLMAQQQFPQQRSNYHSAMSNPQSQYHNMLLQQSQYPQNMNQLKNHFNQSPQTSQKMSNSASQFSSQVNTPTSQNLPLQQSRATHITDENIVLSPIQKPSELNTFSNVGSNMLTDQIFNHAASNMDQGEAISRRPSISSSTLSHTSSRQSKQQVTIPSKRPFSIPTVIPSTGNGILMLSPINEDDHNLDDSTMKRYKMNGKPSTSETALNALLTNSLSTPKLDDRNLLPLHEQEESPSPNNNQLNESEKPHPEIQDDTNTEQVNNILSFDNLSPNTNNFFEVNDVTPQIGKVIDETIDKTTTDIQSTDQQTDLNSTNISENISTNEPQSIQNTNSSINATISNQLSKTNSNIESIASPLSGNVGIPNNSQTSLSSPSGIASNPTIRNASTTNSLKNVRRASISHPSAVNGKDDVQGMIALKKQSSLPGSGSSTTIASVTTPPSSNIDAPKKSGVSTNNPITIVTPITTSSIFTEMPEDFAPTAEYNPVSTESSNNSNVILVGNYKSLPIITSGRESWEAYKHFKGDNASNSTNIKYKLSRTNKTVWDLYTEWYIGLNSNPPVIDLIKSFGFRRWKVSQDSHFFPTRRIIIDYIEFECDRDMSLGRFADSSQPREVLRKILVGDLEKFRINNGLSLNSLSIYFKNLSKANKNICIFENSTDWAIRRISEEERSFYCKRQPAQPPQFQPTAAKSENTTSSNTTVSSSETNATQDKNKDTNETTNSQKEDGLPQETEIQPEEK